MPDPLPGKVQMLDFMHRIFWNAPKISYNSKCIHCGKKENVEHLLTECNSTKALFGTFITWYNNKYNKRRGCSLIDHFYKKQKKSSLRWLSAKSIFWWCIWKLRCNAVHGHITSFKQLIKDKWFHVSLQRNMD